MGLEELKLILLAKMFWVTNSWIWWLAELIYLWPILCLLNRLVEHYASEESVEVPAEELLEVLKYVGDIDNTDFDSSKFSYCISALREKRPTVKCRLIVRIDRNISRGTGTLLSPTDRKLGDKFNNDIVLTLYRVLGDVEKGWYGHPLWIPNIKFPDNTCFYNTTD